MDFFKNIFDKPQTLSTEEFQNYLDGTLGKEGVRKVEEALPDNDLLSDAIEGYQSMAPKARKTLPDFDAFYASRNSNAKVRSIRPAINRMAAALLGVVAIAAVYLYWNDSSMDRLYASNFEELYDPDLYAERSASGNAIERHPIQKQAIDALLTKDYAASITYWEQYLDVEKDDLQSLFYLGYVHLEENKPELAVGYFSQVVGKDSKYKDEVRWYLALAQIKLKDKDAAKATLEDLSTDGHQFFVDKAKSLLEKL